MGKTYSSEKRKEKLRLEMRKLYASAKKKKNYSIHDKKEYYAKRIHDQNLTLNQRNYAEGYCAIYDESGARFTNRPNLGCWEHASKQEIREAKAAMKKAKTKKEKETHSGKISFWKGGLNACKVIKKYYE